MKNKLSSLTLLGLLALSLNSVSAQSSTSSTTTSTTTTNSDGTISQFSPDSFTVKTTTSTDPVSYSSTKTTTYVDENGNPVSVETVKSGLPVTVYYDTDGTRMIATKVVVKKTTSTDSQVPSTKETTTVTSDGTISQFNPDTITVRTTSSADPVSYSYSKTTTYVDENGNPVSMETVKSGLPVTVYYDQNGTKMVATKVIVRKSVTTTTPNP
jgi:hypothetical protein